MVKYIIAALLLFAAFHAGMKRGRSLQRQDAAALEAALAGLESQVERIERAALAAEIIECESGGRHEGVWGDGGRAYGIAQFHEPTFKRLAAEAGMKDADWMNRAHQVSLLLWALENGYGGEWSCYAGAKG